MASVTDDARTERANGTRDLDGAVRNTRFMKTGLLLFGTVGLSAWLGYADYVLWPALAIFFAITIYAVVRQRRLRHSRR